MKRLYIGIGLALFVVGAVAVSYLLYQATRSSDVELPNPNGYVSIRQAALRIGDPLDNPDTLSNAVLSAYLKTNAAALDLMRKGLELPSAVPVEFDANWLPSQMPVLPGLRRLGHALAAEALLYEKQGEIDRSIESCLDLVELGFAAAHRGLIIDHMVGTACEMQGLRLLTNMVHEMDMEQRAAIVKALDRIDSQRESFEQVVKRDKRWAIGANGYFKYLKFTVQSKFGNSGLGGLMTTDGKKRLDQIRKMRDHIATRGAG